MMNAQYLQQKFAAGLDYPAYVATGNDAQQAGWTDIQNRLTLTDEQQALLGGFVRKIHVLVVSGVWCGDCVRQGPMIQAIADATGTSGGGAAEVKWLDRDEHMDLQEQVTINQGNRVPVAIFAAEDFEPVSWFGDKPLSRYRIMASKALGPSCPLPGAPVPSDELAAEVQDWIDEFERVHLILRLSGRLRQKHND